MGLFGRKQRSDEPPSGPDGWVVTDALVDRVTDTTGVARLGLGAQSSDRYEVEYVYLDPAGGVLSSARRSFFDDESLPREGRRCTIAYDPSDPATFEVLESTTERTWWLARLTRELVKDGQEAAVTVTAATPTGRTHASSVAGAPQTVELRVTVTVSPPSGAAFELTRSYWDTGARVTAGMHGHVFYDASAPEEGMLVSLPSRIGCRAATRSQRPAAGS